MTITEKSFILVEENACQFVVGTDLEKLLRKEMRPILWHRMGLFCVVPVESLENLLTVVDMCKKVGTDSSTVIDWKQTFPFPDGRAATILAGLDY